MKNKGYVLTMDAVIALIFVIGVFIAVLTLDFFNPDETSTTAFLNLHYVAEDSMDVLNKVGVLDEIGYGWSISTPESLEAAENLSIEYMDFIIPQNVGYKLEIVEYNEDLNETVITNITNSDDYGIRPEYSDATVITHSSRFLVGFGENKPVVGSVARSYTVVGGLNFSDEVWDEIDCSNLEVGLTDAFGHGFCNSMDDSCCVGEDCVVDSGENNVEDCFQVCYGLNCSLGVRNNILGDVDLMCCSIGQGPCTVGLGNNLQGASAEHSTTATCCGDGCLTEIELGNNILKGADIICCGDSCTVSVDTGSQQIENNGNNIGCFGDNCVVDVKSNKITDTTIFCYGENCTVNVVIDSIPPSSPVIYCCGAGCNATCPGCEGFIILPVCGAPTYEFCEVCDDFCDPGTDEPIVTFYVPYANPAGKVSGSKNITIYIDTDQVGGWDGNYTIDEWGPIPDDLAGFDPENDAIDDALMRLLDKLNAFDDQNSEPVALMNGTSRWEWGDGGKLNPVDLNSTNMVIDAVKVENIRSLWGPVQFKLVVWM